MKKYNYANVRVKFMLLLVQQSKLSDRQDSSASSTTFSLLRQFQKGFNHTQLVIDKALLTADKLKPSSCHRNRTNSFYPLVFMYLHIYLFCLHVMLWTKSFLQVEVSDNLLGAIFLVYLEIMCLLLCNSDTSLWCKVFAKICVVTQLVQGSCLKYYVVQISAGETSIILADANHYLL